MRKIIIIFVAFGISLCTIQAQKKTFTIDERWVGKVENIVTNGIDFAYVTKEEKEGLMGMEYSYYIIQKDKTFGPFDDFSQIEYSSLDKLVFLVNLNDKSFVYHGETKLGPYDGLSRHFNNKCLNFSQDGKKLAFTASIGKLDYAIIDGVLKGPYDDIYSFGQITPLLSNDGKKYAFPVKIDGNIYIVTENGKKGKYSEIYNYIFSPDSKIFAYTYVSLNKSDYLSMNGKEYGPYNGINDLTFSSDSKTFIYCIVDNDNAYLIMNDKKYGPFGEMIFDITLSPDCNRLAFSYRIENDKHYIKLGDEKLGPYKSVGNILFTNDSKNIVYSFESGDSYYIYNNNQPYGPIKEFPSDLVLNPINSKFAFTNAIYDGGDENKILVFYNDKSFGPIETEWFTYDELLFDKNGKYLVYNVLKNSYLLNLETDEIFIGSLYKDGVVYIDGNQIIIEPYKK